MTYGTWDKAPDLIAYAQAAQGLPVTGVASYTLPRIPSWVEDIRGTINSIIDFLLTIMDFTLAALEVIKAFAIGYIDPINAIIDAIIAEVEQVLEDLRKAGIYVTGDWYLVQPPFDDLRGGFAAYQSRMVARFTDTADTTRPDLSDQTPVFAMFLYASADFSSIATLIQFLRQMVGLLNFNLRSDKTLQTPVDLKAQYSSVDGFTGIFENLAETFLQAGGAVRTQTLAGGTEVLTLSSFTPMALVPDVAKLSWKLGGMPKGRTIFPTPPPGGFLVEVSTQKEGLKVYYDRPIPNAVKADGSQDREMGEVLTPEGAPMVLHGGIDQVELDGIGYNFSMGGRGKVKDGAPRVFALRSKADSVPIPLEELAARAEHGQLLQKTFFVSMTEVFGVLVSLLDSEYFQKVTYRTNLRHGDMPLSAEFEILDDGTVSVVPGSVKLPQTFYARVSTVSPNISRKADFRYRIRDATADVPGQPLKAQYSTFTATPSGGTFSPTGETIIKQASRGDRSEPSQPLVLTFPSDSSKVYLQQLTAALVVLVLSRADLEVGAGETYEFGKAQTATGLESFASLIPEILLSSNPDDFFDVADEDTESSDILRFRQSILSGCSRVAANLYKQMGAQPGVEARLSAAAESLLTFKWSEAANLDGNAIPYEQTILESLGAAETVPGLARNPECAGQKVRRGVMMRSVGKTVTVKSREPGFYQDVLGGFTFGSADRSPSLTVGAKDGTVHIYFLRNIIPAEVYSAAAQVLGFASAPALRPEADGDWLSLRFDQILPGLGDLVEMILNWVKSLKEGSLGIVDALLGYIDFLESRILEMQSLLRRLDAIVSSVITIQLPPLASLFLLGNGTEDVLSKFLAAEGPPQDSAAAYGGGVVLLAAGSPQFLNDLFKEMFTL